MNAQRRGAEDALTSDLLIFWQVYFTVSVDEGESPRRIGMRP